MNDPVLQQAGQRSRPKVRLSGWPRVELIQSFAEQFAICELSKEEVARVDRWAKEQDLSRSDAIRAPIERGLSK